MAHFDTVIKGAILITPNGPEEKDLGIVNGIIAAIEPQICGSSKEEIAADDTIVIPGIIDSHVHINEPGNTDWEGFETGSRAALAGGITCIFDMPLNSIPTTTNVDALEIKKSLALEKCLTDFAFWGGLIPGNISELEPLYEAGVIGFKAFMSNSGLDEFPYSDRPTLKSGMQAITRLPGMRLALHAEDNALTTELTKAAMLRGATTAEDFLNTRPIEAELLAIQTAIDLATETNCPIHIVHVSCPEGIDLISKAKANGLDITAETCPHYLCLTSDALEKVGTLAKCAPPLSAEGTVIALREKIRTKEIDTIGSDHSPCPASMKDGDTFFDAWGGISSLQHSGPLTYSLLSDELRIPLNQTANLMSRKPAQRFGIDSKGALLVGMDADLAIAKTNNRSPIKTEDLYYRNPHTPYVGETPSFSIQSTMIRGTFVYKDKKFSDGFRGQFIRPSN